jgi:hypothetical protein
MNIGVNHHRTCAAVAVGMLLLAGCGSSAEEGRSSDRPEPEAQPTDEAARNVAIIAFGARADDEHRATAQEWLSRTVGRCDDLATTTDAADLYAGVVTVVEDRSGQEVDAGEVLRGLDVAFDGSSSGATCRDIAVAFAATMIG